MTEFGLKLLDVLSSSVEDVKKYVFKYDEDILEVSYIRKGDGKDILCVPCQTSCNLGCKFCYLTGLNIKTKNLSSMKISNLIDECLELQPPANPTLLISFMGTGESLMNVDGVIGAANNVKGVYTKDNTEVPFERYSNVRFGVATILPSRSRFEDFKNKIKFYNLPVKLHWSLHSLDSLSRKNLMPAASDIQDSLKMINEYIEQTKNPVEIHYTLINNVNDRDEDLEKFIKYVGKNATIKFLKFAEKENEPMQGSLRVSYFKEQLENNGFTVEVYSPPGRDIKSSCGQFIIDQYTK